MFSYIFIYIYIYIYWNLYPYVQEKQNETVSLYIIFWPQEMEGEKQKKKWKQIQ